MSSALLRVSAGVSEQTLIDRYRVFCQVGEGGFGLVYKAERLSDGQPVALKIGRGPEHSGRMAREARLAAQLKSPYSVRIFGVEVLEDECPMIVMELLEGMSLKEYLTMRGRVEPRLALEWALQLAGALQEAHEIGLVHRDLKPSNLFLVDAEPGQPVLKLLDFGLARAPERAGEFTVTGSELLLGSPAYMSPEQIRGGDVSPRSDIWSFGVVLYEMLAGRRPFQADHNAGLLAAITADEPDALLEVCPHLGPDLSRLVDRCLSKKAADRFADVEQLSEQLRRIRQTLGATGQSLAGAADETSSLPVGRRLRVWSRRMFPSWIGLAALLTLALGVGVALVSVAPQTVATQDQSLLTATQARISVEPPSVVGSGIESTTSAPNDPSAPAARSSQDVSSVLPAGSPEKRTRRPRARVRPTPEAPDPAPRQPVAPEETGAFRSRPTAGPLFAEPDF